MKQFFWRLFQASIVGVVFWINHRIGVVDNPMVAATFGVVMAVFATVLVTIVVESVQALRSGLRIALNILGFNKRLNNGQVPGGRLNADSGKSLRVLGERRSGGDQFPE
jgi:hypothetical protein